MTSPTHLWLDPVFGASGDMVLGTLLGLGVPVDDVRRGLAALDVDGWALNFEPTTRASLAAGRAVVTTTEQHHHRSWSGIDALLAGAGLPPRVEAGARATFARLGEVEAGIHRIPIDAVRFHEVGALDAIVDIVGSWLALEALDVDEVTVGPIGVGHGTVRAVHGTLPVPAPATAELLRGAAVRSVDVEAETVTPTGAALLATMATASGPMPEGRLAAVARGAGSRDPDGYPNVVTGYLLTPIGSADRAETSGHPDAERTTATVLTTNLDDVSGEVVGHTIERCLRAGADDAWATPIVMKKSRPAVELNVLCRPELVEALQRIVFAETGTLGIRTRSVAKDALPRRIESVTVRGERIRVKVGPYGAKPEHDDLAAAAERLGRPVRQLAAETVAAFEASVGATAESFE